VLSSPQHWAFHEDEMDFVLSTCLRSKPTWLLVTAVLIITSDYLAEASPLFPTYLLAFIFDGYQRRQAEMLGVLHVNFISDLLL
jgi:hypothetical protein